ncbi:MAG: hypothetical protein M1828_003830 [Chrysothrix sp. TS-e1954]|nr:MAG: hypothetical protein M1828_003830 [Chrysothrix sp. TS-e1954]
MMSNSDKIILAFDLYGTLLSTSSIAAKLGELYSSDKAKDLALTWRKYQLEYTWTANSMDTYMPFSEITRRSLRHTLAEHRIAQELRDDESKIKQMMQAYDALGIFDDVPSALETLSKASNIEAVVFSNGDTPMLNNSMDGSPGLSQYRHFFRSLVSVEETKRFKPDPVVYRYLAKRVGRKENKDDMSQMWLISGNPFDVVGAKAAGMRACWVDRTGDGWCDGLVEGIEGRPDAIARDLGGVLEQVTKFEP